VVGHDCQLPKYAMRRELPSRMGVGAGTTVGLGGTGAGVGVPGGFPMQ